MFTILLYFTPSIQDNLLIATTKTGILHDQISVAILCMQLMKNYGGLHEKKLVSVCRMRAQVMRPIVQWFF